MPAQSSERIQVGFAEVTLQAIKDLAEAEGLKKARVCSILIEEALIARGLLHSTKMGERMPSSIWPIIPEDATQPPDPEPLTPKQAHQLFTSTETVTEEPPKPVNKEDELTELIDEFSEYEQKQLAFKNKKLALIEKMMQQLQSL